MWNADQLRLSALCVSSRRIGTRFLRISPLNASVCVSKVIQTHPAAFYERAGTYLKYACVSTRFARFQKPARCVWIINAARCVSELNASEVKLRFYAFRLARRVRRVLIWNIFILSFHLNAENYRLSNKERQRMIHMDQSWIYAQNQLVECAYLLTVDDTSPRCSDCLMLSFYICFC